MAEACLVSLVVPSVRSEIARVDQIDETAEKDETDQTGEIDSLFTLSPCPSALDSGL